MIENKTDTLTSCIKIITNIELPTISNKWMKLELDNSKKDFTRFAKYKSPFIIDSIADYFENILSFTAVVPVLGSVAAVLKIVFGTLQTLCSIISLVIATFFLAIEPAREFWFHAFRHIFHGIGNVLIGSIQAIPLIGTFVGVYQWRETVKHSDAASTYYNSQSHKFFAYRTLEDTSWIKYQCGEIEPEQSVPSEFVPSKYKQRLLSF